MTINELDMEKWAAEKRLRPCPFCGGEAFIKCGGEGEGRRFEASCRDWRCPGNQPHLCQLTIDATVPRWNRREAKP